MGKQFDEAFSDLWDALRRAEAEALREVRRAQLEAADGAHPFPWPVFAAGAFVGAAVAAVLSLVLP